MNIIKHGDPKKVEETKRKKDLKRFRCPTCGALWDASISKKECRIVMQDYNDNRWVSDCPEEYCDGIGEEVVMRRRNGVQEIMNTEDSYEFPDYDER